MWTEQAPGRSAVPIIRPVRPGEHALAGEIVLAAYDAAGQIEGPYRETIRDTGARVAAGSQVWVAVADDVLLGTVTFTDRDDPNFEDDGHGDCGFRMLGVAPDAQGRGVGRALVGACIDAAVGAGRDRLAIYSLEWMTAAHRLYGAMGFVRRPDRDVMFPAGVGMAFHRDLTARAVTRFPPPGPVPDAPPWYLDVLG